MIYLPISDKGVSSINSMGFSPHLLKHWFFINHPTHLAEGWLEFEADLKFIKKTTNENQTKTDLLGCFGHKNYMGVSKNRVPLPIIHLYRVFHYKPSFWGTPIVGNTHMTSIKKNIMSPRHLQSRLEVSKGVTLEHLGAPLRASCFQIK